MDYDFPFSTVRYSQSNGVKIPEAKITTKLVIAVASKTGVSHRWVHHPHIRVSSVSEIRVASVTSGLSYPWHLPTI